LRIGDAAMLAIVARLRDCARFDTNKYFAVSSTRARNFHIDGAKPNPSERADTQLA
jgi:hypothetical protein